MKKRFTLALFVLVTTLLKAQYSDPAALRKTVVSLNLLPPSLSVELAVDDKNSLHFTGGTGFLLFFENSRGETDADLVLKPFVTGQFRSYYNLDKRSALGKNTSYNSGNYVGMLVSHSFQSVAGNELGNIEERWGTTVGPVWGIQRNGVVSFGLNLGLGLFIYEESSIQYNGRFYPESSSGSELTIIGAFNLGFNLSRIGNGKAGIKY